jgi:hypothetical protein
MEYHDPAVITHWHKDHGLQARDAVSYRSLLLMFDIEGERVKELLK